MPQQGMHTLPLYYCCMTPYDAKFEGAAYPVRQGERGRHDRRVCRPAGAFAAPLSPGKEEYGSCDLLPERGREEEFEGEDRILVASPKVATYDLQPEMSAYEVADKLVGALDRQKYDFICLNFANGDMVGHTGVYEAIEKAVKAVDACVAKVVEAARRNGYEVVQIADHAMPTMRSMPTARPIRPIRSIRCRSSWFPTA